MPATTAAGLLAVVGVFDVAGTIASGWLTDRVDSRLLLWAYYGLRGLSLIGLPWLWAPDVQPGMWAFIAVSYTHLDVYKRQPWGRLWRGRRSGPRPGC